MEGAKPHPSPLVESAAMASITPPVPTYQTKIPLKTVMSGALSAVQMEHIALYSSIDRREIVDSRHSDRTPRVLEGIHARGIVGCVGNAGRDPHTDRVGLGGEVLIDPDESAAFDYCYLRAPSGRSFYSYRNDLSN
ncbi:strawberry notch-like NTP hydrolase domain-containing protein [Thermodesulfobacteriota bacterium]